jgi:hypothetical protein
MVQITYRNCKETSKSATSMCGHHIVNLSLILLKNHNQWLQNTQMEQTMSNYEFT